MPRIAIICPTLFENDAVGNATAQLYRDLSSNTGNHVILIVKTSGRLDVPSVEIVSTLDLMFNEYFLQADILIYVFAIYSELFDVVLIGNGRAVQVVRFHNVTPPSLVAEKDRSLIERSLRQIQVFHSADEVWADSQENLDELDRRRIPNDKCRLMPLAVVPLTRGRLTEKAPGTVRFIFVGRVVPSKGVDQLIEAAGILQRIGEFEFSLDILGQVGDPENRFIENIVRRIGDLDLQDVVYLKGAVTLDALTDAYSISHVFVTASLHEGFCVPVIEGLAAGCVPISYSNSNLKYIHGGLGLLAASETPDALANAMLSVGKTLLQTWSGKPAFLDLASGSMRPEDFDEEAARYVALFAPDVCARRVVERVQQLTCGEQINGLN